MRCAVVLAAGALVASCGSDHGDERVGHDGSVMQVAEAPSTANIDAAVPPPERSLFDLIDNRLLIHRERGDAVVIDAGSPTFARSTRFHRFRRPMHWHLGRHVGDVAVAKMEPYAELVIPLDAQRVAATQAITLHMWSPERRSLRVAINRNTHDRGVFVGHLTAGWQNLTVPVEEGMLHAGTNVIGLRGSRDLALSWAQVGGDPPDVDALAPIHDGNALLVRSGERLVYYVWVPEKSVLRGQVTGPGCRVSVRARTEDGGDVDGTIGEGVELGSLAGKVARLELQAKGCEQARLTDAAIAVPGEDPEPSEGPPPKYVIVWVMDTLRGDKVRTVNPDARAEVPNMMELAKTGATFRQYYTHGNESQTSHASLWTSLYPVNHHVITSGPTTHYQLSKRFDAIGRQMKEAGLRTIATTSNGTITNWSGYTRNFDLFDNLMHDGTGKKFHWRVPGNVVLDRAFSKIDEAGGHDDPFFLFIGTTDTHKPWYGHEPWLSRYSPDYEGEFQTHVLSAELGIPKGTHICKRKLKKRDFDRVLAIYDSDISFQDAQLGRLVDQLKKWGIFDQTMLVVTADHGEELWEYPRRCGHGSSLRESLIHVPLLIHYPARVPHAVVTEGVDEVDILPTILDALGRPEMPEAQGESLIPLISGVGRGYPRPSYATMNGWSHTFRMDHWKATIDARGQVFLFDVAADPNQRHDLADSKLYERAMLTDALALFVPRRAVWKKRRWDVASNLPPGAADEIEAANKGGAEARR